MEDYDKFDRRYIIKTINKFIVKEDPKVYVTYLLANHCMPTLLKSKPSSLIHVDKKRVGNRLLFLQTLEQELKHFDSRYSVMYEDDAMFLLLIYNKELLCKAINRRKNEYFMKSCGYDVRPGGMEQVLDELKHRYHLFREASTGFPHEIGIVLGYPVRDVKDFIRYSGKNYIFCGCWKVYHNGKHAIRVFEQYRKMRDMALRRIITGEGIQNIRK